MKKIYFIILIFLIGFTIILILVYNNPLNQEQETQISIDKDSQPSNNNIELELPLERARERVIKKPFGIKISPENSPIEPERFSGYHTGVDYEIFENEESVDIEIFAICSGRLLRKEIISGYGGVLIQECGMDNQPVTVIYGHINIHSIKKESGEHLSKGELIALLGQAFSSDTDGERKHLHLGIHKGSQIDIRGYVQSKTELNDWIDFEEHIRDKKTVL